MPNFPKKLSKKLTDRAVQNTLRTLSIGQNLIDFSSNDYLGFAKNLNIFENAAKLLYDKNCKLNGATGSRLITGNYSLYAEVEIEVAAFHDVETALIFNSGYDANVGFFSAVPQRGDIILYDEYIHASIRDGISMSNAKAYKFKHNSLVDLKAVINRVTNSLNLDENELEAEKIQSVLSERSQSEVYIVTESVFSMDGDSPDLIAFANFCATNKYYFVVDEAHAIGVFGKKGQGLLHELGLHNQVFAHIVTYGKAMGCHGAAILGSQKLKEYLVNFARSFIYTTGLPPHSIATILAAYKELAEKKKSVEKLHQLIAYFNSEVRKLGLEPFFIPSTSAIHCCLIKGSESVKKIDYQLQEVGFNVKAILSPTVPQGQERLRFCLHSYTTEEEIRKLLIKFKAIL